METLLFTLVFYLIGSILAYGRITASYYESKVTGTWDDVPDFKMTILLSWISFIIGLALYTSNNEKIFLKFNLED